MAALNPSSLVALTPNQKYGRANEATPAKWQSEYKDYNAPLNGISEQPTAERTSAKDVLSAPPVAPNGDVEAGAPDLSMEIDESKDDESSKKRKKHEGETPEERAERKRRKKEKKEKKEKKVSKKAATAEDDEDSD